jgi:hypothetical protein
MAEVDEQRLVEDAKRIAARFQALLIDSARVGVDPMPLLDGVQRELAKARREPIGRYGRQPEDHDPAP